MPERDVPVDPAAGPSTEPEPKPELEILPDTQSSFFERVRAFRGRHARAEIATFFSAGFLFDVLTLDRIDNVLMLVQQAAYLFILGALLMWEHRVVLGLSTPTGKLATLWRFSEDVIHFLLGSLLSAFSLFYFKSASGLVSLSFLLVVFTLLIANELPRFRKLGPVVRTAIFSFCATSYFSFLLPTIVGFYSAYLFVIAAGAAGGVIYLAFKRVVQWTGDVRSAARAIAVPGYGIQLLLIALYFAHVIPPVPLSVEEIGIYHDVKRVGPDYELSFQRDSWRFWHKGSQRFLARPGDKVFMFVRVFSPSGFRDQIQVRWSYKDPEKGWVDRNPYPLRIAGTRREGYRTFATTTFVQPGDHRVQVETSSGHVIGGTSFEVIPDDSSAPREFKIEKG